MISIPHPESHIYLQTFTHWLLRKIVGTQQFSNLHITAFITSTVVAKQLTLKDIRIHLSQLQSRTHFVTQFIILCFFLYVIYQPFFSINSKKNPVIPAPLVLYLGPPYRYLLLSYLVPNCYYLWMHCITISKWLEHLHLPINLW